MDGSGLGWGSILWLNPGASPTRWQQQPGRLRRIARHGATSPRAARAFAGAHGACYALEACLTNTIECFVLALQLAQGPKGLKPLKLRHGF